jgi:hypothetical protein
MHSAKEVVTPVDALKNLKKLSKEFARSIVNTLPQAQALQEALEELERRFPGLFKAIKTGVVKVRVVKGALEVIHSTEYLEQLS